MLLGRRLRIDGKARLPEYRMERSGAERERSMESGDDQSKRATKKNSSFHCCIIFLQTSFPFFFSDNDYKLITVILQLERILQKKKDIDDHSLNARDPIPTLTCVGTPMVTTLRCWEYRRRRLGASSRMRRYYGKKEQKITNMIKSFETKQVLPGFRDKKLVAVGYACVNSQSGSF